MNTPLEDYKAFIDGLVGRRKDAYTKRILGSGFAKIDEFQEYNRLLDALTPELREILAKLVSEARVNGIHDVLSYMDEMIDCDGLFLGQNGEPFPHNHFESMHYDFIARCDGDQWPE